MPALQTLHSDGEIRLRGRDDRVVVCVQEAAGVFEPSELPTQASEAPEVCASVVIVLDDRAAAVSLRDDVMERAAPLVAKVCVIPSA